ncbi:tumor necrosis factor receptor superfamily member 6B-like [Brachyistius frenatus]|uniref:tumor necrosis factor receptor superfamily member 6B-like n=1 Tax=Brachyistius frenatus TaxID=100188 RepID=UPI0037E832D6
MSTLALPLLFLVSAVLASAVDPAVTYKHRDPLTGEILHCTKCPPGTHMASHCTTTTLTQCAPCRDNHFTELWNYLPRCLYCNNFCTDNQEAATECTPDSNRVCRCKEGFYSVDDFCVRQSECGPGYGVHTKATRQMDTVCGKCSEGYFSNSSSALDSCVKHQECANGQIVLFAGKLDQDTMCGSCDDLSNGGEMLRTFLSKFFGTHKMRLGKMRKFVTRYIYTSEEEGCIMETNSSGKRESLRDQINKWLSQAPEEQLRKMPQMLRASQLNFMAEKLEKQFNGIEQQRENCNLTVAEAL